MSFSTMRYTEFKAECDKCGEVEVFYTGDGYGDNDTMVVTDSEKSYNKIDK